MPVAAPYVASSILTIQSTISSTTTALVTNPLAVEVASGLVGLGVGYTGSEAGGPISETKTFMTMKMLGEAISIGEQIYNQADDELSRPIIETQNNPFELPIMEQDNTNIEVFIPENFQINVNSPNEPDTDEQ